MLNKRKLFSAELVESLLNDLIDNDIYTTIDYIIDKSTNYNSTDELLEIYDNL